MAEKDQPIIIKRINKGHAGAHGGAWKVAYADFVTAMMAFFMVMWLLGSDEETKAAISHYFNNPTSAWRRDLTTQETMPLGDRTGSGENVVNGADGRVPDDLVEKPVKPYTSVDAKDPKVAQILDQMLSDDNLMALEVLKFSIPEDLLFAPGSTEDFAPGATKYLTQLGELSRKYNGTLTVQGNYKTLKPEEGHPEGSYEFQLSRAVAVSRYVIENDWVHEDQIKTMVHTGAPATTEGHAPAAEGPKPAGHLGKIEFTLTR